MTRITLTVSRKMARLGGECRKGVFRLLCALMLLLSGGFASAGQDPDNPWRLMDSAEGAQRMTGAAAWIQPEKGQWIELDGDQLTAILALAPAGADALKRGAASHLTLPTPEGGFETFEIIESPVMAPGLAAWMAKRGWPMKTYRGRSLESPETTLRLDWGGPAGFHASVLSSEGRYHVDPAWQGDRTQYVSYRKHHYQDRDEGFECQLHDAPVNKLRAHRVSTGAGDQLRSYRLAVAATGEYTAYHGGTVEGGQAAIVTSINRVNQVYERDLSLTLTLIDDNYKLVYTDAATDPYGSHLLKENQANVDAVIGSANYDLGHVVSQGGSGGAAYLGSSCETGAKAQGMTSRQDPKNDPFDIDFVAHELGHQVGGNHTYNAYHETDFGSCDTREASAAYEPGGGSTIMAYAGICGSQNLQGNSDDYFHGYSLDEIFAHLNGAGACYSGSASGNDHAPAVDAGPDYAIPRNTPFELAVASGVDQDGDSITYTWEQFDLGDPLSLAEGDNGASPILRSWPPEASGVRVIPRLANLLAGTLPAGEVLPATNRVMNFRVTARDNNAGGGRIAADSMAVTVTTAAGPFAVTSPNGGESVSSPGELAVSWSVANTNTGEVNAANVDILLSTDGGKTYPYTLAAATPNDGAETVTLPSGIATALARIKIKGTDSIFFDISDKNFAVGVELTNVEQCRDPALTLQDPGSVSDDITLSGDNVIADLDLYLDISHDWVGDVSVELKHVDTSTSSMVIDQPGAPASPVGCDGYHIDVTLDDEGAAPAEDACAPSSPDSGAAISGTLTPNSPLSAFDGESIAGTWRLTVSDAMAEWTGTLNRWCIKAQVTAAATTSHELSVTSSEGGKVTSDTAGIDCGDDCSESYAEGSSVTLTATPETGYQFDGWGEVCAEATTDKCTLTINQAASVFAGFSPDTASPSCSSERMTIASPGYETGSPSLSSQVAIDTDSEGAVTIASGVSLALKAPVITLNPGFTAENGSTLDAMAATVTCP